MKVLWVGPVVKPASLSSYIGISPAANKWQIGLITGLLDNGVSVRCITYLPEPYWPKGRMFPSLTANDLDISISASPVGYINIPVLREFSIFYSLKALVQREAPFDVLLTYNPLTRHRLIGRFVKRRLGKIWVSVIADGKSKGDPNLEVFLSYWAYAKANHDGALHLDGGIKLCDHEVPAVLNEKKILLYAGALTKWTGIEDFAYQFHRLQLQDLELHIYGKEPSDSLLRLSKENRRIIIRGFVSEDEYSRACVNASAFINPRPNAIVDGEYNFPSKLLDYIAFGKPIISTKVLGMSHEYDDLAFFYEPNDIVSLKLAILKAKSLSGSELESLRRRLLHFAKQRTWRVQAGKLVAFVVRNLNRHR